MFEQDETLVVYPVTGNEIFERTIGDHAEWPDPEEPCDAFLTEIINKDELLDVPEIDEQQVTEWES